MEKYIDAAVEQFRTLLNEQIARERKMEQDKRYTDYKKLDKIIIGICGGDGIGPIISAESERLLQFILKDEIAAGKIELRTIEGLTIENRIAHNQAIPDDVLAEIKACNVILKAPTTTLKGGTLESANVAMRRELDLYANVRPVAVPSLELTGPSSVKTPRASMFSAAAASKFPIPWLSILRLPLTRAQSALRAPLLSTRRTTAKPTLQ